MELSFIRCPSCRSLVPSSAKTCRMCGAPLAEEPAPRQRVATSGDGDQKFSELVKKVRESVSKKTDTSFTEEESDIGFEEAEDDLDTKYEEKNQTDEEDINLDFEDDEDSDDEDFGEDFDDFLFEEEPEDEVDTGMSKTSSRITEADQEQFNAVETEEKSPNEINQSEAPRQDGVLRGWLVITDGLGQSVELRSGKFLITSQQLRGSNREILIPDSSVSVPHAIIQIPENGPIKVMDLMSDFGTYIQRKNAKTRVDTFGELHDRDELVVGKVKLLCVLFR